MLLKIGMEPLQDPFDYFDGIVRTRYGPFRFGKGCPLLCICIASVAVSHIFGLMRLRLSMFTQPTHIKLNFNAQHMHIHWNDWLVNRATCIVQRRKGERVSRNYLRTTPCTNADCTISIWKCGLYSLFGIRVPIIKIESTHLWISKLIFGPAITHYSCVLKNHFFSFFIFEFCRETTAEDNTHAAPTIPKSIGPTGATR